LCEEKQKVGLFAYHLEGLREPLVVRVPQFENHCFKPSLDLFPHKCTYAKVIDVHSMMLWSVGFIANRHRIPPPNQPVPVLLLSTVTVTYSPS